MEPTVVLKMSSPAPLVQKDRQHPKKEALAAHNVTKVTFLPFWHSEAIILVQYHATKELHACDL